MLQELRKREGFSLQVSDVLVARALPEVARARLKSQDLDAHLWEAGRQRSDLREQIVAALSTPDWLARAIVREVVTDPLHC